MPQTESGARTAVPHPGQIVGAPVWNTASGTPPAGSEDFTPVLVTPGSLLRLPSLDGVLPEYRSAEEERDYFRLTGALLEADVFGREAWLRWSEEKALGFLEAELKHFVEIRVPGELQEELNLEIVLSRSLIPNNYDPPEPIPRHWFLTVSCGGATPLHTEEFIRAARAVSEPFLVTALFWLVVTCTRILPTFSWEEILGNYAIQHYRGHQKYEGWYPSKERKAAAGAESVAPDDEDDGWKDMPEALQPLLTTRGLTDGQFRRQVAELPPSRLKAVCEEMIRLRRAWRVDKWPMPSRAHCAAQLYDAGMPVPGLVLAVHQFDAIYAEWDAYWQGLMEDLPRPFHIFPLQLQKPKTLQAGFRALDRFLKRLSQLWIVLELITSEDPW